MKFIAYNTSILMPGLNKMRSVSTSTVAESRMAVGTAICEESTKVEHSCQICAAMKHDHVSTFQVV